MKTMFAVIGAFVLFLSMLGTFGVGHFVLMYSPDKITCMKEEKND